MPTTLVADLIDHLAEKRGVADPRYDVTLSAYARSLRRFAKYAAAHPELGTPTAETIDRIIDDYLAALREPQPSDGTMRHASAPPSSHPARRARSPARGGPRARRSVDEGGA